jgi:hypothetical protein
MRRYGQECWVKGINLSDRETIELLEYDIHKNLPAGSYDVEIAWLQEAESVKAKVVYSWGKVSHGV